MATVVDEPEWATIVRSVERFAFSLRDHTPYVINQGTNGSSMAIVSTDMVATIHRMTADIADWLELSPQIAIDSGCKTLRDFQHLLTELGIESVNTYPYIQGERPAKDWSDSFYMIRKNKKYRIHGLKYFTDKIEMIRELIDNFKLGGKRFPVMADMFMGDFMDLKISQEAANEKNPPFHTNSSSKNKKSKKQVKGGKRKSNENEGRKVKHTLLIVGMNITADNPDDWFCIVKSSFGEDWGEEGFSRVGLEVFESIYVPVYDPESVVSTQEEEPLLKTTSKSVPVYVSLPMGTINLKSQLVDSEGIHEYLNWLKEIKVDGIKIHCWWGIVERHAPRNYQWDGYKELFQMASDLQFRIQVVMSFHECTSTGSGTDDGTDAFAIPLPLWVVEVGRTEKDIYFQNQLNRCNDEYLCWGIDDEPILKGRTALEAYLEFMSNFREEFSNLFEEGVISLVEVGLGVNGEPRYPNYQDKEDLQYVGEFQCYNKYMKESLKNMAAAQECLFCSEIPEIGGYYDSPPDQVSFFHDEKRFEGRFFLNWYSQELIKHVDRVLALARLVFQGTSLVIKLPTMSCASELTAGYYNPPEYDLCHQILKMLKKHDVGVYHMLGDTNYDSFASKVPDQILKMLKKHNVGLYHKLGDADDGSFASKVVSGPFPISGGNALPCSGKEGFDVVLGKAKHGPYSTFVYNELSPNMMEAQQFREFQEFVTEMHR